MPSPWGHCGWQLIAILKPRRACLLRPGWPAAVAVGTTVKRLRRQAALSQSGLAGCIGVSRNTVGRWENGYSLPEGKHLAALAEFFGIDPADLMTPGVTSSNTGRPSLDPQLGRYPGQEITG